ncbi:MAG: hypothetical protein M3040_12130 [Bacteroidota bacterium]|nr:hypothetical protein [Bacteroidota bacterium]
MHEDWEKHDLISNLSNALAPAAKVIQDKMIELCTKCDPEYGQRVTEGIRKVSEMMKKGKEMMNGNGNAAPGSNAQKEEAVKQAEEMATEAKPY